MGETAIESLRARSGRGLDELTLENVRAGALGPDDFAISADTLRRQAALSAAHGYDELASNLRRGAELVAVPNDELLAIYEALRPRRATYAELVALAERMVSVYDAPETAKLMQDAAEAYRAAGLLRRVEG